MASTTVAALEESVFADPRWRARVEQLRKKWMSANEAFHAMVDTTERVQAWVEQNDPSGGSGGDGGHMHAAELVVAEARVRQRFSQSMAEVEAMVDSAHTQSWDAALASTSLVDAEALSDHEIRCCRACNQGRLAALLGRLSQRVWCLAEPSGRQV